MSAVRQGLPLGRCPRTLHILSHRLSNKILANDDGVHGTLVRSCERCFTLESAKPIQRDQDGRWWLFRNGWERVKA